MNSSVLLLSCLGKHYGVNSISIELFGASYYLGVGAEKVLTLYRIAKNNRFGTKIDSIEGP